MTISTIPPEAIVDLLRSLSQYEGHCRANAATSWQGRDAIAAMLGELAVASMNLRRVILRDVTDADRENTWRGGMVALAAVQRLLGEAPPLVTRTIREAY